MSLRGELLALIQIKGRLSYDEFEIECRRRGHKISTGERDLRKEKGVRAIKNKKGHIIAYEAQSKGREWQPSIF